MTRMHANNDNRGFTLIEVVISIGVFAVASTSIIGVYLSVQRLNQVSAAMQALQQNSRFIIEDITKIIRNGRFDYVGQAEPIPQPCGGHIHFIDQYQDPIAITRWTGDNLILDRSGSHLPSGPESASYHNKEVRVVGFCVYAWPPVNPFGSLSGTEQPTATVFLELETNINQRDKMLLPIQTTIATREYPK